MQSWTVHSHYRKDCVMMTDFPTPKLNEEQQALLEEIMGNVHTIGIDYVQALVGKFLVQ